MYELYILYFISLAYITNAVLHQALSSQYTTDLTLPSFIYTNCIFQLTEDTMHFQYHIKAVLHHYRSLIVAYITNHR